MPRSYRYRGKRNYGRRGRRMPSKLNIYTRKGASSQANQIYKIARSVRMLRRKVNNTTKRETYRLEGHSSGIVYPGQAWPMIDPNKWNPVFSAQPAITANMPTKVQMKGIRIQGLAQIEEGDAVVQCCVYVVSLKSTSAGYTDQATIQMSNYMGLNTGTGTGTFNNRLYYAAGSAALEGKWGFQLNPKAFNIHAKREFMLGQSPFTEALAVDPDKVSNISDANKRIDIKFAHDVTINSAIGQGQGGGSSSWKQLNPSQIQEDKQLYLLFHCNAKEGTSVFFDWHMTASVRSGDA